MRQVFIDTETTGLHAESGDRIIEIGAIELVGRERTGKEFHYYLQPDRKIDAGARAVHGIHDDQLTDCPRFAEVSDELIEFVRDSELIAHNASFDLAFLNAEVRRLVPSPCESIESICNKTVDTLPLARHKYPGARHTLDDLCRRFSIDISGRQLHGALKDASLLADVYLAMTGGQMGLFVSQNTPAASASVQKVEAGAVSRRPGVRLEVCYADEHELNAHEAFLNEIDGMCADGSLWHRLTSAPQPDIQPSPAA
ncbi:MAG: DNA polymerase III subunit epsilon [Gammaproteobacteria bacterium]|nr:DNA polymerase III subunit epsilon [Gammaproteobacteria bacterium]MCY4198815.1 DNA polymerase III subunit epsilon [Gammaproteobacteria bacterium]MCY4277168.1 DNA polymerase III subunit epsilon [Gammaproteobacteria bacterium]MCY4323334.1 DNA polymerase III subunit epsilon [Gammaproteobacteria bacterium]